MDYTTLANVKQYGNVAATNDDALISRIITAYSAAIDNYCNQSLGLTTYNLQQYAAKVDASGVLLCNLPVPVVALPFTAAQYRLASTPVSYGYQPLDLSNLEIIEQQHGCVARFTYPNFLNLRGQQIWVQLSYTGGYTAFGTTGGVTPALPADLESAACDLVWWAYKKREAPMESTAAPDLGIITIPGRSWPGYIKDALSNYRRPVA